MGPADSISALSHPPPNQAFHQALDLVLHAVNAFDEALNRVCKVLLLVNRSLLTLCSLPLFTSLVLAGLARCGGVHCAGLLGVARHESAAACCVGGCEGDVIGDVGIDAIHAVVESHWVICFLCAQFL